MRKVVFIIVVLFVVIFGLFYFKFLKRTDTFSPQKLPQKSTLSPKDTLRTEIISEGLEVPWSIAFLPDGGMLVTERPGRVRIIDKDGVLNQTPILELSVVRKIQGEGGLHGVTLHPDFDKNNFVYIYYTYENQGNRSLNRVSRYTFDGKKLIGKKIII